MKKNEKQESRVLARVLAREISSDALKSIAGGCTGQTCTASTSLADTDTDRTPFYDL